ncbi:MAG: hypothetical protein A2041_12640 [Bacteroidetes bacterium GWA2_31_9b]|nr:MAG: hypothetical protein A2041_12640 [Bacteroidetes bacterium GWA2_31_9b]
MRIIFLILTLFLIVTNISGQKNTDSFIHLNNFKRSVIEEKKNSTEMLGDSSFVSETDSLALVALFNSTNGANWNNNTNWLTGHVHSWFGIQVGEGNVISIVLYGNNLEGVISSELGNLSNIEIIDLDMNKLSGSLPAELGNLSTLKELYLDDNLLTGSIPIEFGNLTSIIDIYIFYNQLSGSIPVELCNLATLQSLFLGYNNLTGNIPSEIGNLSNLQLLDLNNNQLTGSIPAELGNLTNLQEIYLNNNQFSGTIPAELDINSIVVLELSNNQLTGSIPIEFGNLINLDLLNLGNNQLADTIPSELGSLVNLTSLDLSNNDLIGTIPTELGNLVNLQYLALYNNQLSGKVPEEFGNLTSLQYLYLSFNNLSDLTNLSTLVGLNTFEINNNNFTFGDLDSTFLDFTSIPSIIYSPQKELDEPSQSQSGDDITLSFNTDGSGNTYQWINNGTSIEGETTNELTISSTDIGVFYCEISNSNYPNLVLTTKPIFKDVGNTHGIFTEEYNAIIALYNSTNGDNWAINTNWLSAGNIDQWYGILTSEGHVIQINLPSNNLFGTLPFNLGYFSELTYLDLSDNQLSDSIPEEIGDLSKLQFIDLSDNQLVGVVPSELSNLINLEYIYLSNNMLSDLPDLSGITNLFDFDVNNNKFTFDDLDNTGLDYSLMDNFIYAPQDTLELINETIYFNEGSQAIIHCRGLSSESLMSANNEFSVYKENDQVYVWSSSPEYTIASFATTDQGKYIISVRNSDYPDLILFSDTLIIGINHTPTNIEISSFNINENEPLGTSVGVFSATDADLNDTHTFSLVTGNETNDADNSSFTIDGDTLKVADVFDYETKQVYYIYVQVDDAQGLSYNEAFVIAVSDIVETGIEIVSESISVFPNPSSGQFTIENSSENFKIKIFNSVGELIFEKDNQSHKAQIELSGITPGTYIVVIQDNEKVVNKKFIIK